MNKKRIFHVLMLALSVAGITTLMLAPVTEAATFQLPAGTEVKVKFSGATKISSGKIEPGTKLPITLAEPIKIGDVLLVAEGAAGSAVVKEVKKAAAPGKPGKLVVEFVDMGTRGGYRTADGSAIKLSGKVEKIGKGKKLLSYVTIIGIAFIKGGQGEIDTRQVYTATVAQTTVLQSE
jgi:hypothetical protein